jgi:hypothetical protein
MMKKIIPTNLEQMAILIRSLPLKDFDKLREIIDKEIANRRNEEEGQISPERAVEVLWMFHDDFYNEEKDAFSQNELTNSLRWILTKYEEQKRH